MQVSNSLPLFIVARNQNSKIFATNNLRANFLQKTFIIVSYVLSEILKTEGLKGL